MQLATRACGRDANLCHQMLDIAHKLQAQWVKLRSPTEAVDTGTSTGRLMFNLPGATAASVLDLNRERTLRGLRPPPRPQGRAAARKL